MNYGPPAWLWLLSLTPVPCQAAELKTETVKAWDAYYQDATSRMRARLNRGARFLWLEEAPDRIARAKSGEILVSPVNGSGRIEVPHGLIHHWIAAAFFPGATLEYVLSVVHDYHRYQTWYQPTVTDSRLISCDAVSRKYSMRLMRKVFLSTAAVEVESESRLFQVTERDSFNLTRSTRVQEIDNFGKPDERLLDPGAGAGYVWHMATIIRVAAREGGTFVELEALLLSRDISASSSWLISPLVKRLSRSALTNILARTRTAVQAVGEGSLSSRD